MQQIDSMEAYFALTKALKKDKIRCVHDVLTNEEAERFISLGRMGYIRNDAGIVLLLDEELFYRALVFMELNDKWKIRKMDKPVLVISRYRESKKADVKAQLEKQLRNNGFVLKDTAYLMKLDLNAFREKYAKQYEKSRKLLDKLNYKVQPAVYAQWDEIKEIFTSQNMMKYYHEHYRTEEEIKKRFDQGEFNCVIDDKGKVIAYGSAYRINGLWYGDSIVVKDEYKMLGLPFVINYYGSVIRGNDILTGSMLMHNKESIKYHQKIGYQPTDQYIDSWMME